MTEKLGMNLQTLKRITEMDNSTSENDKTLYIARLESERPFSDFPALVGCSELIYL